MLNYWRDTCLASQTIYRRDAQHPNDRQAFALNYVEFGFAANELNKFPWAEVPNDLVLAALIKYRGLCMPLSNFMLAAYPDARPANFEEFTRLIAEVGHIARG